MLAVSKHGVNVSDSNKDAEFTVKVKLVSENGLPVDDNGSYHWYIIDDATGEVVRQDAQSENSALNRVKAAWRGFTNFIGVTDTEAEDRPAATPSEME